MYINKDIWALIEQESSIFQALHLCDTLVVVHAHDFFRHVLWISSHPFHYGGDYLQIKANFVELLKIFDKCRIRPIFVFGGISVPQVGRHRTPSVFVFSRL